MSTGEYLVISLTPTTHFHLVLHYKYAKFCHHIISTLCYYLLYYFKQIPVCFGTHFRQVHEIYRSSNYKTYEYLLG